MLLALFAHDGAASISLVRKDIPVEGEGLAVDAIFARVDSLWTLYDTSEGTERGRYARRLGELHLATDMIKHRPRALELLDEAARLGFEARRSVELMASTQARMRFVGEACTNFGRLVELAPDDPTVHVDRGRFEFLEARRRMDMDGFANAASAFARATELDPDADVAWFGLAASTLATRSYEESAAAAHVLVALRPDWSTARLLAAAADQGRGEYATAWHDFHIAFDRLPSDVASVFTQAQGFVDRGDLVAVARSLVPREELMAGTARVDASTPKDDEHLLRVALRDSTDRALALSRYLDQNDERPAQEYRIGHMRFWTRLVEADVLFGDPSTGTHGWETPMGETLVRWGRPSKTFYHPGAASIMRDLLARGFVFPAGWSFETGVAQYVWGFDDHPKPFSLVFYDESRQDRFTYEGQTSQMVAVMRKSMPIVLPERKSPKTPFTLALSRAVFPRGWDQGVVETYIGVRPQSNEGIGLESYASGDTLAVVEWALFDAKDRRIDHRTEILDVHSRRSILHAAAGTPLEGDAFEPWISVIGAALDAGNYRIAVEVATPDGSQRNGATLNVTVPKTFPPSRLEMSDLQVATHIDVYRGGSAVPLDFVKFGQVVLTAPDLRIPSTARTLAVYFELRHLGLSEAGTTHFDVSYEVFSGERKTHDTIQARADYVSGDMERVEPLTLQFLEERTGVSSEGLVVKGTSLDVTGLPDGDYVLRVTIHDHHTNRTATKTLPFRKGRG